MPFSAVDTISLALEHTKQQLFRPFRLGKWLRLALIGFMTGELSSGGGCNPSAFTDLKKIQNHPNGGEEFLATPHMGPHLAVSLLIIVGFTVLLACRFLLVWVYVGIVYPFILIVLNILNPVPFLYTLHTHP